MCDHFWIGLWRTLWWPIKHRFVCYEPSERVLKLQRAIRRMVKDHDLTLDDIEQIIDGKVPARFRDPALGPVEIRKSPLL